MGTVKEDVLSLVSSDARYTSLLLEFTGFGLKDCQYLPSLGRKFFNSRRLKYDDPIYTHRGVYMRHFVREK